MHAHFGVLCCGCSRRSGRTPFGTPAVFMPAACLCTPCPAHPTGTRLPGTDAAVAQGNSLGKGAMLFHLPQPLIYSTLQAAAAGDSGAQLLRLELARLGAAQVVETCEGEVGAAVYRHLVRFATLK